MTETIGYCEGLCGGLLSHHLVGGLCPLCRENPMIRDVAPERYGVPLGVEAADARRVRGADLDQLQENMA